MKIRPVILCGGAGTRLWPNSKNHQAKQFIILVIGLYLEKHLREQKHQFMTLQLLVQIRSI